MGYLLYEESNSSAIIQNDTLSENNLSFVFEISAMQLNNVVFTQFPTQNQT